MHLFKESIMPICETFLEGIPVDIYYSYSMIKDAYGTGDSPTQYDITIHEVELRDSTTNIYPLVENDYYYNMRNAIILDIKEGEQ
jgi:hypothetical protein